MLPLDETKLVIWQYAIKTNSHPVVHWNPCFLFWTRQPARARPTNFIDPGTQTTSPKPLSDFFQCYNAYNVTNFNEVGRSVGLLPKLLKLQRVSKNSRGLGNILEGYRKFQWVLGIFWRVLQNWEGAGTLRRGAGGDRESSEGLEEDKKSRRGDFQRGCKRG